MYDRFDIVIPEYEEKSKIGEKRFNEQLERLDTLQKQIEDLNSDNKVMVVDDHSNDGSWELIKNYNPEFTAYRMPVNGKKIGAIKELVKKSDAQTILQTDFDSRLVNPEYTPYVIERMYNEGAAGVALNVQPEQNSIIGRIQDIDYKIGQEIGANALQTQTELVWNKNKKKLEEIPGPKRLRCVAGAGGIWRKDTLEEFLEEHSGRHNGDDMETSAIAMKKGYDILFDDRLTIETEVPESFYGIRDTIKSYFNKDYKKGLSLFKQRTRWKRGALETFEKENEFYTNCIKEPRNRLGYSALWEVANLATVPIGTALTVYSATKGDFSTPLHFYGADLLFTSAITLKAKDRLKDKKSLALLPLMPLYRTMVAFPSTANAIYQHFKDKGTNNDKKNYDTTKPITNTAMLTNMGYK